MRPAAGRCPESIGRLLRRRRVHRGAHGASPVTTPPRPTPVPTDARCVLASPVGRSRPARRVGAPRRFRLRRAPGRGFVYAAGAPGRAMLLGPPAPARCCRPAGSRASRWARTVERRGSLGTPHLIGAVLPPDAEVRFCAARPAAGRCWTTPRRTRRPRSPRPRPGPLDLSADVIPAGARRPSRSRCRCCRRRWPTGPGSPPTAHRRVAEAVVGPRNPTSTPPTWRRSLIRGVVLGPSPEDRAPTAASSGRSSRCSTSSSADGQAGHRSGAVGLPAGAPARRPRPARAGGSCSAIPCSSAAGSLCRARRRLRLRRANRGHRRRRRDRPATRSASTDRLELEVDETVTLTVDPAPAAVSTDHPARLVQRPAGADRRRTGRASS